ncbi:glycosyltransferase [Amycolatopsis nigrescens]|uniref:glycosyltransferase n=1 Tax=Amycolatopsis nigrescens TaxID=381445 RepID=UPI0003811E63|nr:glycosyltransferase [Amycolatopsis nigrescens]
MKVLILTQGTRGDVQVLAALAKGLHEAGHEVVFCAPGSLGLLAEPYSSKVVSFTDVEGGLMRDPTFGKWIESNEGVLRGKLQARRAKRMHRALMGPVLDDLTAIVREGADVVLHHVILQGHDVAERLGVQSVPVCVQPCWVPTSAYPNPMTPNRVPVPRVLNRATYLTTALGSQMWAGNWKKWREDELGLPPRRNYRNIMQLPDGSPATVLQPCSEHVLPGPLDFPDWVHTTGYWFLPAEPDWTPPPGLPEFLDSGTPPVYIGFGSMVGSDPNRTGQVITEAVRQAGVRAVVVAGWGGIQFSEENPDIFCLEQVPFEWLFPRVAAIVHHGGMHTAGAAFASGRPQVICPFRPEHNFWAKRTQSLGVSPGPVPRPSMTPERLAAAIRQAVTDQTMAVRAKELGDRIATEDGITRAVKVLESIV